MLTDGMADAVLIEFLKVTEDVEGVDRGAGQLTFSVTLSESSFEIVLSPLLLSLCGC